MPDEGPVKVIVELDIEEIRATIAAFREAFRVGVLQDYNAAQRALIEFEAANEAAEQIEAAYQRIAEEALNRGGP